MSYTLIDYFKAFHSLKQELNLPASAQAAYFSILGEFNAARFPELLSISDRELKALSGLKSVATAHDAKRILKNSKLIDFTSKRGAFGYSEYHLSTEHLPNINRTLTEHLPNNSRTLTEHSSRLITHSIQDSSQDVKTGDIKTEDSLSSLTSTARAGACAGACVNRNADGNRTLTEHLPNIENPEMDVYDPWEHETGYQLHGSVAYELEVLEKKYKREAFHAALLKAVASNTKGKVSFNYFKAILEGKKGVKESGGTAELHYDEPDADTVYPWDKSGYASDSGAKQGTS